MLCPNDHSEMHRVQAMAHYGQSMQLEQCTTCGGVWFDEGELFRVKHGEAERVENLNTQALVASTGVIHTLQCPVDTTTLTIFSDDNFPRELIVERCPQCQGIWMNRGEFTQYQTIRKQRMTPKQQSAEDQAFEKRIEALLAPHQTTVPHALETFGRFLSTPIEPRSNRVIPTPERSSEQDAMVNRVAYAAIRVLGLFLPQ